MSHLTKNNHYSLIIVLLGSLLLPGCIVDLKRNPAPLLIGLFRNSADTTTGTGSDTSVGAGDTTNTAGTTNVATPTFSPAAGHYNTSQNVILSSTTSGASLYYTTDGSNPTTSSNAYTSAIPIWYLAGKTVQAFATKSGFTNSSVLSGTFSYPPLQSGQTTVYLAGDNGTNPTGAARAYTDSGDGSIIDNATGLVWQKCFKGRNNDATCSDDAGVTDPTNWANSGTYCSSLSLAGKTWRLPSKQELETLPDYSLSNPAISSTFFPGTIAAGNYWSSTAEAANAANAWYVGFGGGDVSVIAKTNTYYVRCVTGFSKVFGFNFTDNNNGTIKDNATGLVWQKCFKGRNNDTTCSDDGAITDTLAWASAVPYCTGLSLAGYTWRLPHANELNTIVDTTKASGAIIDTITFPSTAASVYWSSTTTTTTTYAWLVNFSNGAVGGDLKTNTHRVRCVTGP